MTDDEINRKVAEIEGWVQDSIEGRGNVWIRPPSPPFTLSSDFETRSSPPPYATDWAWCGPLVEKHKVSLTDRGDGGWSADVRTHFIHEYKATPHARYLPSCNSRA